MNNCFEERSIPSYVLTTEFLLKVGKNFLGLSSLKRWQQKWNTLYICTYHTIAAPRSLFVRAASSPHIYRRLPMKPWLWPRQWVRRRGGREKEKETSPKIGPSRCASRVILILTKFGILTSTWFQVVPFGLRFWKQFLFLKYDPSFCCP